jgi:hypothetical protein
MSCFVLDPGGSREIGLCPHLRIYPITKLVTPLGTSHFLCGFLYFSMAIFSGSTFLLSYQSLSLQDILIDLLGPEAFVNFALIFKFFIMFRNSRTALHCSLRELVRFAPCL